MKKIAVWIGTVLLLFLLPVGAAWAEEDSDPLEDSRTDLWESIPEEVRPLLPEGIEEGDGESIARMIDGKYILNILGSVLKDASGYALKLFLMLLSVTLLCTLGERLGELMGGDHTRIFGWIFTLCAGALIFSRMIGLWQMTRDVLSRINQYMTALISIQSALYLAGGNSVAAAVHMGWLSWLLTAAEKLSYSLLLPTLEISFSGTMVSSIAGSLNFRPFVKSMQNFTAAFITLIMTVLSVIMTFQTALAAAADSAAMRALKFAAAGSVPIIGGMISESVRTLSAGISAMKGIVGTVGVTVVILLSLSPFLTLLFARWALSMAGAIAEAAGGQTVAALIADASRLIGFFLAILALFDLFFLYSLSVFVRTTAG